MLARARRLTYYDDTSLRTPCLVPSFSSRGFPFVTKNGATVSSVSEAFQATAQLLNNAALFSAFDLHHSLIYDASRFWSYPEIVFVDSGGYETGVNDDLSDIACFPPATQPWSPELYVQALRALPESRRVVAVSYDSDSIGMPIRDQVAAALALFEQVPGHVSSFLIKPTSKAGRFLATDQIAADADLLRPF